MQNLILFLQTCSWYRRFISVITDIAEPLSILPKKKARWLWGTRQIEAFNQLKAMLTTIPISRQADQLKPFILRPDASAYALGACLLQRKTLEDERPIDYISRLLTAAEKNYSTTEREALAVVWSVTKFTGYLEYYTVIIQSDHQPLKWSMSLRSPSGRLAS